jgi:D-sedoheptulose 7-phosphate isomerase
MLTGTSTLADRAEVLLLERNSLFRDFFAAESQLLAEKCREMAERFSDGGRLLAFGRGACATDAQHVAVEFVHPVIVGKRALPALDLSMFSARTCAALVQSRDIVMGFSPPEGDRDREVEEFCEIAFARDAMTFALPGTRGSYSCRPVSENPFLQQELIEILYHTLWETVHVFLERRQLGHNAGASSFLYPFLGSDRNDTSDLVTEAAASIRMKAEDDATLRAEFAANSAEAVSIAVEALRTRLTQGGKLILFGNGGSATDANDWAMDCVMPPSGYEPIPAISLSMEPACLTALANDVGVDVIFLRQLIAHAQPEDVAIAISTSGGSRNIIAALEEARRRKLLTIGLLGCDGGEILRRGLVDHALVVSSDYIPRIQEVQASVYHTIRELMEEARAKN